MPSYSINITKYKFGCIQKGLCDVQQPRVIHHRKIKTWNQGQKRNEEGRAKGIGSWGNEATKID